MKLESLVRKNIRALTPYHSARQDFLTGVLLDANENACGSVTPIDGLVLNRYPDPSQRELRAALAEKNDVALENVFVGVGSDEVIDLLVRVFCEPREDSVVILEPTYGMYRVAASIQDVEVRSCLLNEKFQIDREAVKRKISPSTKIIFCCSPNNPTANLLRSEEIIALCELGTVVIVDEAYIEFSSTKSLGSQVLTHPNLVVLRTLSKAWGLAGIRLGYCLADSVVISYLMKVKPPYNVNVQTSRTALESLRRDDELVRMVASIIRERAWLEQELTSLSCVVTVFPSDANFLLVRCTNASAVYQFLAARNIIVRNRSTEPSLQNCLRITVGTHNENQTLIRTMKEYTS